MKPYLHAKTSVKKWGGIESDYQPSHEFLDESKAHHADMRHRAILHNSFGIYLAARLYGDENGNITNSDGKKVSVRDIAEIHVLEDMGRIPSVTDYLSGMPLYEWLGGPRKTSYNIPMRD